MGINTKPRIFEKIDSLSNHWKLYVYHNESGAKGCVKVNNYLVSTAQFNIDESDDNDDDDDRLIYYIREYFGFLDCDGIIFEK